MYQTKSSKAIGINPGLANCGYAVISRNSVGTCRLLESGSIKTYRKQTQAARLLAIYQDISQVIHAHHPNLVAIEKVYFNRNVSSAISTGNGSASKEMMKKFLDRLLGQPINNHHEADAAAIAIAGLLQPNIKPKKGD